MEHWFQCDCCGRILPVFVIGGETPEGRVLCGNCWDNAEFWDNGYEEY